MKSFFKYSWGIIEAIVKRVLKFFCDVLHKEFSEEIFESIMQFIKFGIVGVSNVLVSYVLYVLFLGLFREFELFSSVDYLIAQSVSFMLSVVWSFYWNNKMVFVEQQGEKRSLWKALLKTFVAYSFSGLVLNNVLLILWVKILHIPEIIAPILSLLINVPINFIMNKFWAFREKNK